MKRNQEILGSAFLILQNWTQIPFLTYKFTHIGFEKKI